MTSLLLLIPLSLGMGLIGLGAFFWAMRHGQFDDPEGSAWRVIHPQDPPRTEGNKDG
ncbi:MAG: cbb3-type cytochrome oxidase assembly protein CcoS [Alphaproteobacteria bacterium HGW-Alphaproteobacteria-1]|jgi:cbb3-type cytochrome oxidase maturation protein|nr:MAG: cbb3-type cytochrome oxidase assembly protein CcoS [Alphaproteobacteria bacterium HGW-Alphaproteobacteria-5]PKQ11268.1 MAG: cbb3-type cytochrome oxidase assembly protein CcoS [Alphaproteobacteria bacterium HGW-Alphaproteobacteria-1]